MNLAGEPSPHVAVPPRHLAATITALAVLRAGWAVAGGYLVVAIIMWLALWIDRGYGPIAVIPLLAALAVVAAFVYLVRQPNSRRGVIFLAVGTVSSFLWVWGVLLVDPQLNLSGLFIVNRMTIVLLLVGPVGSRLVYGIVWCTAGWVLGSVTTIIAQSMLGIDWRLGFGPTMALLIYIIIIALFVGIRRSQRRFSESFSVANIEPARITGQRELEERAVVLIHDTVLNDLGAIIHGKDELDDRTRSRFRRDIESVTQARIEPETVRRDAAGWLRRELLSTISDFQWQGIRVDLTGVAGISTRISPHVAEAVAGAIRGSLDNVVKHSSSDSAELFVDSSDTELSVMIVDHGSGFDVDAVSEERLGIRHSIVQRIEDVGGSVKIWSAPGVGTSVIISVPVAGDHE